jgi:4-hydroxy-2-oxoheptanedioate aldolase
MPDRKRILSLKQALGKGEVIFGTSIQTADASQVEIVGHAGFDFAWLDTQHSSYDIETGESLIRAADAVGIPCLMRVWKNAPALIGKALDFGAQGIVVPEISTADEAHQAVRNAQYAPLGSRSGSPTVRATHYGHIPWTEHLPRAQGDTLVVLQIEGREGIERLDEIMAVAGIDVLFIGAFDLSTSLGISGQLTHPRLLNAVGNIVQRAKAEGINVGLWMREPEQVGPWIAQGVQMITVANTNMIFFEGCRNVVNGLRARIPPRSHQAE